MKIPNEFQPIPDIPKGKSGWEYMGERWINLNKCVFAFRTRESDWQIKESMNVYGVEGQFFLRAMEFGEKSKSLSYEDWLQFDSGMGDMNSYWRYVIEHNEYHGIVETLSDGMS